MTTGTVCERVFPGRADQVPQARHWVCAVLGTAGAVAVDDAVLVVSELATNALRHSASGSPGGKFAVVVQTAGDTVVLHVRDQGQRRTHRVDDGTHAADGDGHGHGMAVVAALSAAWGIAVADVACGNTRDAGDPLAGGRCTWCRLPAPAGAVGHAEASGVLVDGADG